MNDPVDCQLVKVVGEFDTSEEAREFQLTDRECEKDYNSFLVEYHKDPELLERLNQAKGTPGFLGYSHRFNQCTEEIARVLDSWHDTKTEDMTEINELVMKHAERKKKQ